MANKVYDEDNPSKLKYPNLADAENKVSDGVSTNKANDTAAPGTKNVSFGKTPSSNDLKTAESSTPNDQLGRGYVGSGDGNKQSRGTKKSIRKAAVGRKKGLFIGGGIGALLIAVIVGIGAIIPFELVHIEKVLLGYEAKIEQHFEKDSAQKLMQKMVCMQLAGGCKNDTTDKKATTSDAEKAAADGEQLTSEIDSFDITSPAVEADLAKVGITVKTDSAGNLTALDNSDGLDISQDIGTNTDGAFADMETALPEYNIGQEITYRPLMTDEAGESFSGLDPTTADDQVDNAIDTTIEDGATGEDISYAASERDTSQKVTNPNDPDSSVSAQNLESDQSGQLGQAIDAVETDLANGATESQAVADASSAFKLGDPLLLSSIASDACDIKGAADKASSTRVPTIETLLMRHSGLLISMADELKSGKLNGGQVNQVMKLFNGDPTAAATSTDPSPEARQPFSSSAEWIKATGGAPGSDTHDITSAATPSIDSGTKIVAEVDNLVNQIPGGNLTCRVSSSPFGFIVQGLTGFVQFFADDATLGLSQAAITAGIVGLQYTLQHVVIPDIISYFTPLGINGHEDSVQWMNNAGAGTNLSFGNFARSRGAMPVSYPTANAIEGEANNEEAVAEARLPIFSRIFSISDPGSLASRVLSDLPIGLSSTVSSLEGYFTNFPSILLNSVSSIFTPKASALAATAPGQTSDITQYALTDTQVNKYDPVANEQYLFSDIKANGKSVRRIDALGNPNIYVISEGGDSNNLDMLHCFVDSYYAIETTPTYQTMASSSPYNPNQFQNLILTSHGLDADTTCGNLGGYDYVASYGSTTNSQLTNLPGDLTLESVYCMALQQPGSSSCQQAVAPQIDDDLGRYSQYLLNVGVMNDYTSLTNSQ